MFLIDGYNLLHVLTRGRVTSETRGRLVDLVEEYCRRGGYRARIVFDPTARERSRAQRGAVEVRYAREGVTADEEILRALAATSDRTAYTVVSNDGAIVREAERRQFKVVSCEAFARLLLETPPPAAAEGEVPPGEVDHWLREFGLDDDDATK